MVSTLKSEKVFCTHLPRIYWSEVVDSVGLYIEAFSYLHLCFALELLTWISKDYVPKVMGRSCLTARLINFLKLLPTVVKVLWNSGDNRELGKYEWN